MEVIEVGSTFQEDAIGAIKVKRPGASDWDSQILHIDDYELVTDEQEVKAVDLSETLLSPEITSVLMRRFADLTDGLEIKVKDHDRFIATMRALIDDFDQFTKTGEVGGQLSEYIKPAATKALEETLERLLSQLTHA